MNASGTEWLSSCCTWTAWTALCAIRLLGKIMGEAACRHQQRVLLRAESSTDMGCASAGADTATHLPAAAVKKGLIEA